MALWVAGLGFLCHGEALDEKYDGNMLRPSDMKQIVTRFYNAKRTRREKVIDAGGLDLTNEHNDDDVVGDVHHMYITQNKGLMNIARITPVTKTGKAIIDRVKNSSNAKGKPVGLSYDYVWHELGKGDNMRTGSKYVKKLSIVEEPAHHKDGTYITEWAESEDELLQKLFSGIYGPDADEKSSEPFHITNALKKQVVALFEDGKDDEKSKDKTVDASKKEASETAVEEKKEKAKGEEKAAVADKNKKLESAAPPAKDEAMDDPMEVDDDASKKDSGATASSSTTETKAKKGADTASKEGDAMEIEQTKEAKGQKKSPETPAPNGGKKEAPVNQRTPAPLFDNKGDKDNVAQKASISSLAAAIDPIKPGSTKPSASSSSIKSTQKPEENKPPKKMESNTENNVIDQEDNDAMDLDETPTTNTKGKQQQPGASGERKTESGALKRPLPPAQTPKTDEGVEDNTDANAEEKTLAEPAGKKQKTSENTSKPTSAYGLTPRDADIQLNALNSSFQDLLKWANLKNAPQEEQAAFIQEKINSATKQLMDQQKSADLTIRNLLANAGLKESDINTFVEAAEQNEQVGQAVRTMAAAAHAGGMNHRLYNIKQQEKKNEASFLDMAQTAFSREANNNNSASIFNSDGSMKRQAANLDFSSTIFGFQQQQQSQPQQQQGSTRRQANNNQQSRQSVDTDRRVGGSATPSISPEEQARREEEKLQKDFMEKLEVSGPRIVRTIPFDPTNPIFSIRDEYGELALDSHDIRPEQLENIKLGGYAHRFMSALKMTGTRSANNAKEIEYTPYGDDKHNDRYYATLGPNTSAYRAPRRIQGGLITIGGEDTRLDS